METWWTEIGFIVYQSDIQSKIISREWGASLRWVKLTLVCLRQFMRWVVNILTKTNISVFSGFWLLKQDGQLTKNSKPSYYPSQDLMKLSAQGSFISTKCLLVLPKLQPSFPLRSAAVLFWWVFTKIAFIRWKIWHGFGYTCMALNYRIRVVCPCQEQVNSDFWAGYRMQVTSKNKLFR